MTRSHHLLRLILLLSTLVIVAPDQTPPPEGEALLPEAIAAIKSENIHLLTTANWTVAVLESADPWVMLLEAEGEEWRAAAAQTRGVVRFGAAEPELAQELKHDWDLSEPASRVFNWGSKQGHDGEPVVAMTPAGAVESAVGSIPDEVPRLERETIGELVVDALEASPSTFPVLIFTTEDEVPVPLRALIPRLERYFRFGMLVNPAASILKEMSISVDQVTYPGVLVLAVSKGIDKEDANALFSSLFYNVDQHGEFNYFNLLNFFADINAKNRPELRGSNFADQPDVLHMTDVMEEEIRRLELIDTDYNHGLRDEL